jgi:hypothetical protein
VRDCQWIQQLHSYGLLRGSFRPAAEICALRALVRQRENLVHCRAAHIQHMQKALHLMNVQLTQVVSDITGLTGLSIIRAMVAGERDPLVLARLRQATCAKSEAEIAKALAGNYQTEHLFALRQALQAYDFYQQQKDCDREIEACYAILPPATPGEATLPALSKRPKAGKNQPRFDLASALYQTVGVDLTAIEGIDALTAQVVLSEIGLDMSRWPTVKHFTSWLGLAPHNEKSGGKVLRSHTKRTTNRANTALRIAAQTLARSQCALGAFYRRIRAKHGAAIAITATAHKLARVIYVMLKERKSYQAPDPTAYDQQYQARTLRNLKRKAAQFGMRLLPLETAAMASPTPAPLFLSKMTKKGLLCLMPEILISI